MKLMVDFYLIPWEQFMPSFAKEKIWEKGERNPLSNFFYLEDAPLISEEHPPTPMKQNICISCPWGNEIKVGMIIDLKSVMCIRNWKVMVWRGILKVQCVSKQRRNSVPMLITLVNLYAQEGKITKWAISGDIWRKKG